MNKVVLIAGGTAVVSLAVGATGGYFFALKKAGAEFDERLEHEMAEMKKSYALRVMRADKPADPRDIPVQKQTVLVEKLGTDETTTITVDGSIEMMPEPVKAAMTDYQGLSTKRDPQVIAQNIFDKGKEQRPLPPRGPGGKFAKATPSEEDKPGPERITADEYLDDPYRLEMGTLRWYPASETLLTSTDADVAVALVGGLDMLKDFPTEEEVGDDEARSIWVRNVDYGWAWEITLMDDDLTVEHGFEHNRLDEAPDDLPEEDEEDFNDYSLNED